MPSFLSRIGSGLKSALSFGRSAQRALPAASSQLAGHLNRAEDRIGATGRQLLRGVKALGKRPEVEALKSARDIVVPHAKKLLGNLHKAGKGVAAFSRAVSNRVGEHRDSRQQKLHAKALERAVRKGDTAGALEAGRKLEVQKMLRRAGELTKKGDSRSALRYLQLADRLASGGRTKPAGGASKGEATKPADSGGPDTGAIKTGKKGGRYVEHNGKRHYIGGALGGSGKAKKSRR